MDNFRQKPAVQPAQQQVNPSLKAQVQKQKKNGKIIKLFVPIVIVLIVLAVGLFVWQKASAGPTLKKKQYQAVFLTNGQVYFGKLQNTKGDYLRMTDVYYLQVQNQENQQTSDNKAQEQTQQTTGQPQLIKLGQELHGPEDELNILRTQISFWENLKDNGKVVQAIKQNQKK